MKQRLWEKLWERDCLTTSERETGVRKRKWEREWEREWERDRESRKRRWRET